MTTRSSRSTPTARWTLDFDAFWRHQVVEVECRPFVHHRDSSWLHRLVYDWGRRSEFWRWLWDNREALG